VLSGGADARILAQSLRPFRSPDPHVALQLGFVIDHTRCIGCHACTVACKSENNVPLGDFRTWVKYTETGAFPEVRRSFAVLRCNQCTDAPCVSICPVTALEKKDNGIVDLDQDICIGCKSCMHACPYDALYINEESGTAEKCHFCAHRTEVGLAPACAVVCPTEAIIPGDFDDPESVVSRMTREFDLSVRKPEAGTKPNVRYREVSEAGIDPSLTNKAGGYIWSNPQTGAQMDAQTFEAFDRRAEGQQDQARTVYDVPRKQLWGSKITDYLFTKSLAGGIFPLALVLELLGGEGNDLGLLPSIASFVALAICLVLLVLDLKRPERFYLIMLRPNWDSWLARGSFVILAYQVLLVAWIGWALIGGDSAGPSSALFVAPALFLGGFTACYTAWLFAQAKGRVLWMRRYWAMHLVVQATLAGSAFLALAFPLLDVDFEFGVGLTTAFLASLVLHMGFTLTEGRCAPKGREEEYHRAARLLTKGPWAKQHWYGGVLAGIVAPIVLLTLGVPGLLPLSLALPTAGLLALIGLRTIEDAFVRAGQALPIS
jgi:Fe-S-cluster-containing dehydrogenase component/formate-dependent nitrite reductase membrane component NrfD